MHYREAPPRSSEKARGRASQAVRSQAEPGNEEDSMPAPFDFICRRSFLGQSAVGLGGLALASLLGRARGAVLPSHFPAKAKRVIHLCMAGGPSQFESLDYKPELKKLDGKPFPE